jgi:hypothetical protein
MPPVKGDNLAGSRSEKFFEVCEVVTENDRHFSERDVEFARDMVEKIVEYGERSFISVSQINWINRLEQKCRDEGLI